MAEKKVGLRAVFETTQFQRGVQIYTQGVKIVNQGAKDAEKQSSKSSKAMADSWEKSFASIAKKAIAVVASFLAVQKAAQFMKQTTLLAARVETLGVALETVGRNAGYSSSEIAGFEKAVKDQGITTQASRQALLGMAQAQIDFTHAADLARIAQDAAVIANTDSSDAFQRLTFIIQTGNVRMARYLGLQVSFQKGYERMAVQLDKTTEELTEQERVQARVNVVLQAGTLIAGTYAAAMQTSGKMMFSLNRLFEETQLVIGQVNLGAFAIGIDEVTRLVKELLKWMEENKKELDDLGLAVEQLVGAMVAFADLDLPVEQLTDFVDELTTLASMLAVGIEAVKNFRTENTLLAMSLDNTLKVLGALNKFAAWPITAMDAVIDKFTEMRKVNEDAFKTLARLREERKDPLEQEIKDIKEANRAALAARRAEAEAAAAAEAERLAKLKEMQEKAAEQIQTYLDRIADMQRTHDRRLLDMADDHAVRQERAWAKYGQGVTKEIIKGRKRLEKLEAGYQKRRVKAIAAYSKRVVKAEKDLARDVEKAQADFARRENQVRQRRELGRIQSERRYQFERRRLVAEGDALAIEQLDERHKLEQEEAKENEALRQRQVKETQAVMVKAMREAGREQAVALAEALAEQLKELKEESREEADEQRQANIERLQEMAGSFADQQRLADEDYQRSVEKANLNYERREEDLGRHLARDEELQELSGQEIESIMEHYYGEDGITREVMEGYYEWLEARAIASAAVVAASQAGTLGGLIPPDIRLPMSSPVHGMDAGGIVTGPQTVQVGAGVTEAFIPLTGSGAGGAFTMEFINALQVAGLGAAGPAESSAFLKEFTRELTRTIRTHRRG